MPKPFPEQFRRDVVAIARRRESSLGQIAKDFGISRSCLQRWLKVADVDEGRRDGLTTDERHELSDLRKRNKTLEQENYILRRAAAYLSQGSSPK